MPSAYLQWRFHSGERVVARGPLVCLLMHDSASFSHDFVKDVSRPLMLTYLNLNIYFIIYACKVIWA